MKTIIAAVLAIVLAISFSACEGEELPEDNIPEENISNLEPIVPENEENTELYEKIILNFGAVKEDDGNIHTNKTTSLYYADDFENGAELSENTYFSWALFYLNSLYDYETREEIFVSPFGENTGWAYPSEYYEPPMEQYFGVSAEKLRSGSLYYEEYDCYWLGGGGGIGLGYEINLISAETDGDILYLHLELYEPYGKTSEQKVLKVRLSPDGSYQYISYLSEKSDEETRSMTFKLGKYGETVELSAGDTIGDWVLESLEVDYDKNDERTPIDRINAEFSGTVTLEGRIERNMMLEHAYDFVVSEEDRAKLPCIVYDDYGNSERFRFILDIPEGLENYPDLDFNESLYCRITVSACSRGFSYTEGADGLDVVEIEPDTSILYKEMLINFGGNYNYEGKLTVNKGASLYYDREGYKDCSSLETDSYYVWMLSRTSTEDRTEVSLPGFASPVYAYDADYYEVMVNQYFGTSAEYLRKSDFYYPDQRCYYIDAGGGGIGLPTYIDYISAEEKGNTITIHLALSEDGSKQNFALTAKLLPEGGYNYISYLPE